MTVMAAAAPRAGPWRIFASRLLASRAFIVGAVLFGVVVLVALLAPLIAPVDPNRLAVRFRFRPPSAEHWLGTDNLGRSMWSRVVHGGG